MVRMGMLPVVAVADVQNLLLGPIPQSLPHRVGIGSPESFPVPNGDIDVPLAEVFPCVRNEPIVAYPRNGGILVLNGNRCDGNARLRRNDKHGRTIGA